MIWDGTSRTRPNPNVRRAPDGWDYASAIAQIQELQREITPIYAVAHTNLDVARLVSLRTDGHIEASDFNISNHVFGMNRSFVQAGQVTPVAIFGLVSMTDWTSTVGTFNLSPGWEYFLETSGRMTLTPPNTGYLVKVGRALSHTDFLLKIEVAIKM
jgi:hypothetical protein